MSNIERRCEPRRPCGHYSPMNYDHSRRAKCALPAGHDGDHRMGDLYWRSGFMPCRKRSISEVT